MYSMSISLLCKFLTLFFSMFVSIQAVSAPLNWFANGNGKNELHIASTQGAASFGSGVSVIELTSGYMRRISSAISVGGDFSYVSVSYDDASGNAMSLYGLGHYIFDAKDFMDSFYGLAGVGVGTSISRYSATSDADTKFGIRLGMGKRTSVAKQVLWRPEAYYEKAGDMDGVFVLKFLDFSYVW